LSENNLTLNDFLDGAKSDVIQVTNYFLEFFIDGDFINLISDFRDNKSEFIRSMMMLKEEIPNYEKNHPDKFTQHGLNGKELQRKLILFNNSRKMFHAVKFEFINSFKSLIEKWKQSLDEPVAFEKLNKIPPFLKIVYDKTRDLLKRFKKYTLRHLDIINIYLKSLVSVVGVGGLASEFKDTIEAVMKSRTERNPPLVKTIKHFGADLLLEQIHNVT
jgi:hypothetical protein